MTLIEELYALQEEHGYLREADLKDLSKRTRIPLYEVEGVSSFYPHFRKTPAPRAQVTACRDLTCRMNGGEAACARLKTLCGGLEGVEFHEVSCLGRCDAAPAATVNDVPVRPGDVSVYLEDPSMLPEDEPTATPRDWKIDGGERYAMLKKLRDGGDLDAMIDTIKQSGLRGLGGAGFPTGLKWEIVRKEPAEPKYVICNADESEPGTFKDRVILEELPHRIIEGMALAALAIGARKGWVYIRHEYRKECVAIRRAIDQAREECLLGDAAGFDIEVFVSPGGYILGEETALLEALEGKRGEPRNKPPYPGQQGLWGQPTLINNVESFAMVPYVLRNKQQDVKFFSVSGDVNKPGVYELAKGTTLRQLIEVAGGMKDSRELLAFQPGGASTSFLPADKADVEMDWKPLQDAGSSLGSGAVVIVGEGRDMFDLARNLTAFFRNESCGKCVPCRIGTQKAVEIIDKNSGMELMPELHETLLETSICGLGQAALNPILSVLKHWPR